MPKKRKNKLYACNHFTWKIYRRGTTYHADGRSNPINLGRHSLATTDLAEAETNLKKLDLVMAVRHGVADESALAGASERPDLALAEGRDLYKAHTLRPRVTGGASEATWKRYRAVFDKFIPFARDRGVTHWEQVTGKLLQRYGAWLDGEGYAESTEYLELTAIKQVIKFLIEEEEALSPDHLIRLKLTKPITSSAYCYTRNEVQAILLVANDLGRGWVADAIVALTRTGLRISELAKLRWDDIDLEHNIIVLSNDPAIRVQLQQGRRFTKNRKDRTFPIHPDLRELIDRLPHHEDGLLLHGPLGGKLKADTLRNNLVDRILPAAERKLTEQGVTTGIMAGRLHSCRHFFCSQCVEARRPEQVVMAWLGHQDSQMVRRYYHLKDAQAQEHMQKLNFTGPGPATEPDNREP